MLCFKLMILVVFLQVYPGISDNLAKPIHHDAYDKGVTKKVNGKWVKALDIWFNARVKLMKNGKVDPRIGFAYMNLATQKKAVKYYKSACIMYFWALKARDISTYHDIISKEILQIKPMLTPQKFREMMRLLKKDDPRVMSELRGFWIQKDPTPTTFINERLLEHYERIAYAKEHFRKNTSTIYGTDDRGTIYVKYGAPSRLRKGTIVIDRSNIEAWAREMLYKTGGRSNTSYAGLNPVAAMRQADQKDEGKINYIVHTILQYNNYNNYEIWVYNHLNNEPDRHVIFIFGSPGSGGGFGLLRSFDELMSPAVFRQRRFPFNAKPFNIGTIMQLLYYQQVKQIDNYFSNAFLNLESSWVSENLTADSYAPLHTSATHKQEIRNREEKAPKEKSTYNEELPNIWIKYKQARYLGQDNKPYSILFVYSKPQHVLLKNYSSAYMLKNQVDYYVKHNITLWNKNWLELTSINQLPDVHFDKLISKDDGALPSQTIFKVEHKDKDMHARIAVDAYNLKKKEKNPDDPFPAYLLGTGKEQVSFNDPLTIDKTRLELSDIVLGYQDSLLDNDNKVSGYHFYVPFKNDIPHSKNLWIHLEVYHLQKKQGQNAVFDVDYRIIPLNKKGKPVKKDTYVGLTLKYESPYDYSKENLQIDLSDIKSGKYRLKLKVNDKASGQSALRYVDFIKE